MNTKPNKIKASTIVLWVFLSVFIVINIVIIALLIWGGNKIDSLAMTSKITNVIISDLDEILSEDTIGEVRKFYNEIYKEYDGAIDYEYVDGIKRVIDGEDVYLDVYEFEVDAKKLSRALSETVSEFGKEDVFEDLAEDIVEEAGYEKGEIDIVEEKLIETIDVLIEFVEEDIEDIDKKAIKDGNLLLEIQLESDDIDITIPFEDGLLMP